MTIFFSADHHIGHSAIRKYCDRQFQTAEEMNEHLVQRFNALVKPNDTVYYLGDLAWSNQHAEWFFDNVKCQNFIFVFGNHDRKCRSVIEARSKTVHDILEIDVGKAHLVLCHYAMRTWNRSSHGSWQLHGHSHGQLPPNGCQMDVGVDPNGYAPVSFEQVAAHMAKQMAKGCGSCEHWCRNCSACKVAQACSQQSLYKSRFRFQGPEDPQA